MKYLFVRNGLVVNVVNYLNAADAPLKEDGCDVVPAVTGTESHGDAVDITDVLRDRRIDNLDVMVFKEMLRLTNEVRALRSQGSITAAQYRTALRNQG